MDVGGAEGGFQAEGMLASAEGPRGTPSITQDEQGDRGRSAVSRKEAREG